MRTFLQCIVLIMGAVLVLSGCASVADEPLAQVEEKIPPTVAHTQIPQSIKDEVTATMQMTEPNEIASDEVVETETMSNSFIFYDSHATW